MASPQTVPVAWVSFQGDAAVLSTASAYNVASLTDNGVGDYTLTWGTALADANYVACGSGQHVSTNTTRVHVNNTGAFTTASARMRAMNGNNAAVDPLLLSVIVLGNL